MTDRCVTVELVTDSNSQIDGCSYSNSQVDDYAIGRPVADTVGYYTADSTKTAVG